MPMRALRTSAECVLKAVEHARNTPAFSGMASRVFRQIDLSTLQLPDFASKMFRQCCQRDLNHGTPAMGQQ